MNKINELLSIIFGFIVLLFYIIFKKQGSGKFYIKAQENKLLNNFLKSKILFFLFKNYKYFENNIDEEFSEYSKLYQKDDSILKKYTGYNYGLKESEKIEEQQRGFGIPTIRNLLNNNTIKNIIEIGTGNGDLIFHFAKEYRDKSFTGIDFKVDSAKKKHKLDNLNFVEDYALNHFLKTDVSNIDLIFASSTFIFFTPKELTKYLKILSKKCKFIIITDPTWYGMYKKKFIKNSYHLEAGVFFHNYNHYFKDFGFDILKNKFEKYQHKLSPRSDIYINIIFAKNNKF
tara:strand:- start:215 stop:1075 length:861 start_codon:yes stop_codon:yes gene_type:complete